MFPIFAAIGAALAAAAVPVAKAVALGAAGGAAAFGTTKALEAVTKSKPDKPKADAPLQKPTVLAKTEPTPALASPEVKAEPPAAVPAKTVASLTPAWSALQNPVPDHLRLAEQTASKSTAPATPLAASSERPQTTLADTPQLAVQAPVLPHVAPVSLSPVIRL